MENMDVVANSFADCTDKELIEMLEGGKIDSGLMQEIVEKRDENVIKALLENMKDIPSAKIYEPIIAFSLQLKNPLLTNILINQWGKSFVSDFNFLAKFGLYAPEESVLLFLDNYLNNILIYGLDHMERRGGRIAEKIYEKISKEGLNKIRAAHEFVIDKC